MECNTRVLEPEELMLPLLELMEHSGTVPLVISGNSMSPFLVHRRDTVYLSRPDRPLRRGDMILYRRDSGDYILHRICNIEGDTFTLIGDAQTWKEPGIRQEQVLAVVTAVRRKGKLLRKGDFWWDFFESVWLRVIPLRRPAVAAYTWLKREKK